MTPLSKRDRSSSPTIGERWRNKNTGKLAMVLNIRQETRHRPTGLAQAPDGRLIFLGDEKYHPTWIYFEDGAPPGFDDRTQGGWDLDSWLEHWERDEAETARAAVEGMAIIGREDEAGASWWQWRKRRRGRRLAEAAEGFLASVGPPEPPIPPDYRPVD